MDAAIQSDQRSFGFVGSLVNRPHFLLAVQLVAFWNIWQWMAARFATSTETMWEVLPLLSVILLCWFARPKTNPEIGRAALISAAAFLFVYAASHLFAPPLVGAVFAMASIGIVLSSWRFATLFHPGIYALLLLCLPVTESLNFYLGYPMRVVVGEAVGFLLRLQGLDVYREGVGLHFNEQLIWIDAPCSGIKMLWFGIFLAAFLSALLNAGFIKQVSVLAMAFIAILAGNILRASALFYLESGMIKAPEWMHSAVGVVAFAATSLTIVFIVMKVSGSKWQK
jgi:exosortase/archaeosortase family protein